LGKAAVLPPLRPVYAAGQAAAEIVCRRQKAVSNAAAEVMRSRPRRCPAVANSFPADPVLVTKLFCYHSGRFIVFSD
jgi:hypothetical protein